MRLILFDCDGTLVDSQATIVTCVQTAFVAEGLAPPAPALVRRIVGLSLVEAMAALLPEPEPLAALRLAEAYKAAFREHCATPAFQEPLFPGTRELLDALRARDLLLGVATGKGMRGLRFVLEHHGLSDYFVTLQTADLHPSKPHPAMVHAAMAETGAAPEATMVVGDTVYDILMAVAARAVPVGVSWGNHPAAELVDAGARRVLDSFAELPALLPVPERGDGMS